MQLRAACRGGGDRGGGLRGEWGKGIDRYVLFAHILTRHFWSNVMRAGQFRPRDRTERGISSRMSGLWLIRRTFPLSIRARPQIAALRTFSGPAESFRRGRCTRANRATGPSGQAPTPSASEQAPDHHRPPAPHSPHPDPAVIRDERPAPTPLLPASQSFAPKGRLRTPQADKGDGAVALCPRESPTPAKVSFEFSRTRALPPRPDPAVIRDERPAPTRQVCCRYQRSSMVLPSGSRT